MLVCWYTASKGLVGKMYSESPTFASKMPSEMTVIPVYLVILSQDFFQLLKLTLNRLALDLALFVLY